MGSSIAFGSSPGLRAFFDFLSVGATSGSGGATSDITGAISGMGGRKEARLRSVIAAKISFTCGGPFPRATFRFMGLRIIWSIDCASCPVAPRKSETFLASSYFSISRSTTRRLSTSVRSGERVARSSAVRIKWVAWLVSPRVLRAASKGSLIDVNPSQSSRLSSNSTRNNMWSACWKGFACCMLAP